MASSEIVRARIDANVKVAAVSVLSGIGLSLSDAIRILLTRIAADGALPFDVSKPAKQRGAK